MKDFAYIANLAKMASLRSRPKEQLKIAIQLEQLLKSVIAELQVKIKKET